MKCSADGADDAYGFVFLNRVVSRKAAGVLCAFDVVDAVADAIGNLVPEMSREYLLEIDYLSVIAFNRHADVSAGCDSKLKSAFFMKSDVHLHVDDLARKAVIGEIREKPERGEENKRNKNYQRNGDNGFKLCVRGVMVEHAN